MDNYGVSKPMSNEPTDRKRGWQQKAQWYLERMAEISATYQEYGGMMTKAIEDVCMAYLARCMVSVQRCVPTAKMKASS